MLTDGLNEEAQSTTTLHQSERERERDRERERKRERERERGRERGRKRERESVMSALAPFSCLKSE